MAASTSWLSGACSRGNLKQGKGSFELLAAGHEHSCLKLNLDGGEVQQVVAGNRVWLQPQVSGPVQELPDAMARSTRLAGWQLATGDWRGEFPRAHVLKRIELDGQPVFIVHAAPAQGRQRLIYLDAENGLTLASRIETDIAIEYRLVVRRHCNLRAVVSSFRPARLACH